MPGTKRGVFEVTGICIFGDLRLATHGPRGHGQEEPRGGGGPGPPSARPLQGLIRPYEDFIRPYKAL